MSETLPPGRLLGERFRLLAPLDRGGWVWRAVDERSGGAVAIRLHRGQPGPDPTARVVHANVVSIFSFGTHEGTGYSVMELVVGVSLATVLDEGTLPEDDMWRIAAEVCQALHAAHSVGVAHGNLKPSNVLIADGNLVKVGGFTGKGGPRQDMYSLGLLMEAMSGRRDPIVKRLLSRDPYLPSQLHEILTGMPLGASGAASSADEVEADDRERPRLVRLAVLSAAVTLAVVIVCAWFVAPTAPPQIRSQGTSGGPAASLLGQPSPAPDAASKPAPAPPAGSTGAGPSSGNSSATPGINAINAVRAVIAGQLSAGQIQPEAATQLNNKLDDIAKFYSRGQTKQTNDRIDSFKTQLAAMRQTNKVTQQGYDAILASLDTL